MGKVLFWNVAGAGTGDKGEELSPTLAAYCDYTQPDCVVVCEMRKVRKETKEEFRFVDYFYVKPNRPQQANGNKVAFYHSDHDKRLYVYSKNPGAQAWQLTTGRSRPTVLLLVGTTYILVMHAPSKSTTSSPQTHEMREAYDLAVNTVAKPVAIFGDLNIDLQDTSRMASLVKHLGGHTDKGKVFARHALADWQTRGTGGFTHNSKSELDWALCDPTFAGKVTNVNFPRKRRRRNDNDAWGGEDVATKSSDHVPVLLSW